jgi:FkbM family methyltransferase
MSSLMQRVKGFRDQAAQLGWARTAQLRFSKRLGRKEIRISVPGLKRKVAVRVADSDIYDFNHSLGRGQEPLSLGFDPRVIIDAGANVGYTVLRFSQQFPKARIIAIEPEQENIRQLLKNCEGNENLSLEPKALWSHSTRLRITNPEDASNAFIVEEDESGKIEAISIDDVMRRYELDSIDLLKIDIEGSEKEVFEHPSAQDWLPKVRALLVETHDNMRSGTAEAVKRATLGHMTFQGHVGEYEFYLRSFAELQ